jgi:Ras-related protein Rab-1A
MSHDNVLNFIIIGDSGVGKSSILYRFIYDKFLISYNTTFGIEFLRICKETDTGEINIKILDTSGQIYLMPIIIHYMINLNIVLLVYDVTNRKSFDNIKIRLGCIKNKKQKLIVLIGNKIDLDCDRKISTSEGKQYAVEESLFFYETSAKDKNNNINKLFLDQYARFTESCNSIIIGIKKSRPKRIRGRCC